MNIFTKGSITYSCSSLFFPRKILSTVGAFYSFLRVIDNLVDELPVQAESFYRLRSMYSDRMKRKTISSPIIENMCDIIKTYHLDPEWIGSFWDSMEWDLQPEFQITSMEQCLWYMRGSAEVVGLIMAKLVGASKSSFRYAMILGRAMQYANFLRDIGEDAKKGRRYIPLCDTTLITLSEQHASEYNQEFYTFMQKQLSRYYDWISEGIVGIFMLPMFARIPIVTAARLYHWIALQIKRDPMIVWQDKKIKPSKSHALFTGITACVVNRNSVSLKW